MKALLNPHRLGHLLVYGTAIGGGRHDVLSLPDWSRWSHTGDRGVWLLLGQLPLRSIPVTNGTTQGDQGSPGYPERIVRIDPPEHDATEWCVRGGLHHSTGNTK
jgi:hypothetical protein